MTIPGFNKSPDPEHLDECLSQPWYIRILVGGGATAVKVWPATDPELSDWSLVIPDEGYLQNQLVLNGVAWSGWTAGDAFVLDILDMTLVPTS